jgi:uncharacterized RDD family membrane protein YckC
MDEHNPYRPPQAAIAESIVEGDLSLPLAGRGERLLAVIIDTVMIVVPSFPVLYLIGYFDSSDNSGDWMKLVAEEVLMSVGFILLFVAINAYPLQKTGQSWGKRMLGIRIVDLAGRKPELWRLLFLRYFPTDAVGSIPFIGWPITLLDALMIFRADRRCLHDFIAGTRVVVVERPERP